MKEAIDLYNKAHQNPCWSEISFWLEKVTAPLSLENKPCIFIETWEEMYLYEVCDFYCRIADENFKFIFSQDSIKTDFESFTYGIYDQRAFLGSLYYVMHVNRNPKDNDQKAILYKELSRLLSEELLIDLIRFMCQTFSCVTITYKEKEQERISTGDSLGNSYIKDSVDLDLHLYDKHIDWGNFVFGEEVSLDDVIENNPLVYFIYKLFLKQVDSGIYEPSDFVQIFATAFYYSLILRMSTKADIRWPNIERDLFSQMKENLENDEERLGFAIPILAILLFVSRHKNNAFKRFLNSFIELIKNNDIYYQRFGYIGKYILNNKEVEEYSFIVPFSKPLIKQLLFEHGANGIYVFLRHCENPRGRVNEYIDNAIKSIFEDCQEDKECMDFIASQFNYAIWGKEGSYSYNTVFLDECISDRYVFSSEDLRQSAKIKKKLNQLKNKKSEIQKLPQDYENNTENDSKCDSSHNNNNKSITSTLSGTTTSTSTKNSRSSPTYALSEYGRKREELAKKCTIDAYDKNWGVSNKCVFLIVVLQEKGIINQTGSCTVRLLAHWDIISVDDKDVKAISDNWNKKLNKLKGDSSQWNLSEEEMFCYNSVMESFESDFPSSK